VHGGALAARHRAADNANYVVSQRVGGIRAGGAYNFGGWVNIPSTTDAFTFKLQVRWLNSANAVIATKTVKTYTAPTGGWVRAAASLVAPAGSTSADVRMVVGSLNATIYADDFSAETSSSSSNSPSAAAAPAADNTGGNVDESKSIRPDEQLLTGDTVNKVRAAALAKYPGATVLRVETDSDGVYEAHLRTSSGERVTVEMGKDFAVTGTETGGPGRGGPDQDSSSSSSTTGTSNA